MWYQWVVLYGDDMSQSVVEGKGHQKVDEEQY